MKSWQTALLMLGSLGIGAGLVLVLTNTTYAYQAKEPVMQNEEVIEWTDRKGRKRRMVVHRTVRE